VIDFPALLRAFADHGVRFLIVDRAAATAHGFARRTRDLDVVYDRAEANLERLVRALGPHEPYLRGAPPGLPFVFDRETLRRGLNFRLTSKLGDVDLLGEIVGGGGFDGLEPHCETPGSSACAAARRPRRLSVGKSGANPVSPPAP